MECRYINKMRCPQPNEEILTNTLCGNCLLAHISNQLNKVIKILEYRPQQLNTHKL